MIDCVDHEHKRVWVIRHPVEQHKELLARICVERSRTNRVEKDVSAPESEKRASVAPSYGGGRRDSTGRRQRCPIDGLAVR